MSGKHVLALSGGVGGAKLAAGLAAVLPPEDLTIVVNTGDDFEHLGLHVSPDIDTLTYTLAGLDSPETGWGRADETWTFMAALEALHRAEVERKHVPGLLYFNPGKPTLDDTLNLVETPLAELPDERDSGVDLLFSQMPEIEIDDVTVRTFDRASSFLFLDEGLGQTVARTQFHRAQDRFGLGFAQIVILQVTISIFVDQDATFATRCFGNQDTGAG